MTVTRTSYVIEHFYYTDSHRSDDSDCHFDVQSLQRAFGAALARPFPIARLWAAYADFASDLLHDDALAIHAMREAVAEAPGEAAYRVQLAHWLAIHGMTQEAVREIDALRRMDSFGRLDSQIETLEEQTEHGGPPAGSSSTNGKSVM